MHNRLVRWLKMAAVLCLTSLATMAQISPAQAWFKVCNQTSKNVYYEHTISDPACGSLVDRAKGWWFVAPGQCAQVFSGSMNGRFFAYYAEASDGSLIWNNPNTSTVSEVPYAAFDYCGAVSCNGCGGTPPPGTRYLTQRFKNGTATNYTLNLTP